MTTISQSTVQTEMPGILSGFVRRVRILANALADGWDRRAAIKALRELDDRELRDIGLMRSHIETAVSSGARSLEMGRLR